MSESKLIELGYYDPSAKIRLSAYADIRVQAILSAAWMSLALLPESVPPGERRSP